MLDGFYVIICINAMQCNCKCNSLVTSFPSHQVSIFTHTHSVHFSAFSFHNTPPSVTSHQYTPHNGYNAVAGQCGAGSPLLRGNLHPLPTKQVEKVEKVKYCEPIHTLRSLTDHGGNVCKVWFRSFRNVDLYKVQTNIQTNIHLHM